MIISQASGAVTPTVSQQLRGIEDLVPLVRVGDVQLVEVRLLQPGEVFQALEAVHRQQGAQLLKEERKSSSSQTVSNGSGTSAG